VATVYQRQLSVPSPLDLLLSTSESWGVNGRTTRCTSPVSVVLRLPLVSGWGLKKRRSAPHHGPLDSGKDFTFLFYIKCYCFPKCLLPLRNFWKCACCPRDR